MDFTEYLVTVRNRAAKLDHLEQVEHAQLGMISEVGEIANMYKRVLAYGRPFDPVNLLEEVGDVLWYYVLFCDEIEVSMRKLDTWSREASAEAAKGTWKPQDISDQQLTLMLAGIVGYISNTDNFDVAHVELSEVLPEPLSLLAVLLHRHGFTIRQALIVNDAKLTARNGGEVFNLQATLDRDLANERAVLEAGAGNGQTQ